MKEVEYFTWWMPPWSGKKPYRSRWKMSREDAVKHGALVDLGPVEYTREVRTMCETQEEQDEWNRRNATNAWLKAPPKAD